MSRRVLRDERLTAFMQRIERLEDDDRELLIACGLEGLPAADAARRLGLSRDATAKRWQRLRRRLEEEGVPALLLGED